MTSNKPYFIRALYDWIVDNALTPHILVDASYPGLIIPENYVVKGQIIFNISPDACRELSMSNDIITFMARFGHQPMAVSVFPGAVLAIYAQENGKGMEFELETPTPPPTTEKKKPALKLVKK